MGAPGEPATRRKAPAPCYTPIAAMKRRWPADRWIGAALTLTLAAVYVADGGFVWGNDATANVYLAANLVEHGRLSFAPSRDPWLFEWRFPSETSPPFRLFSLRAPVRGVEARALYAGGIIAPAHDYFLAPSRQRDPATGETRYVGTFGAGAGIAAAPVLAFARAFARDLPSSPEVLWYGAKVAAALLVALSAAAVFLTCRRWLPPGAALALALAYGLGTSVWSTSSQALWQHASSELFLALGTLFLVRARGSPRDAALSAAAYCAAVACRPTGALFAVAAAVWLAVVDRRALLAFAAAGVPFALAVAGYNLHFLGSPLRFGQTEVSRTLAVLKTGSPDLWQTPLWLGLAGVLASPSRGLFVFSPFLLLAIPGAAAAWRRAEYAPLRPVLVAVALVLAVEAKWFDWWGGWAYGYRRVVDLAPALVVLVAPTVGWVAATTWRRAALAALVAWSVLVQGIGALAYDVDGWNARAAFRFELAQGRTLLVEDEESAVQVARATGQEPRIEPLDVDRPAHRGRLWSLRDSQIAWYLTHFAQARRARAEGVRRWLELWRPPPGS